jgi:hypothetical protein
LPQNFTHPWIADMLLMANKFVWQVDKGGGKKQKRRKKCQQFH